MACAVSTPPKPDCWAPEYAEAFHQEVAARDYHLRPPYPDSLFNTLAGLVVDRPGAILDLGCGPGDLAPGSSTRPSAWTRWTCPRR